MQRKITALAVGTVAVVCGVPTGASAAEPGFTVDPQSPAGVEYQVPLDSARGQGGGGPGHHGGGHHGGGGSSGGGSGGTSSGAGGSSSGTSSPALFGTGITPATAGSSGSRGTNVSRGGGRNGGGGRSSETAGGSSRSLPSALSRTADYSSTGPLAGIIAAILVAGGGLGLFLLRMRARRPRKIFS